MNNKLFYILCFLLTGMQIGQAQVVQKLRDLGMENIRAKEANGRTIATFENQAYRGTYRGIGKAIVAGMEGTTTGGLVLVALDNGIPQLCITLTDGLIADYRAGRIGLKEVYAQMGMSTNTDKAMEQLRGTTETVNSGAGKTDIVVYPEVLLENSSFDKLYTYAVNLAPAVETTLWKGAKLTAQVVVPIATNLKGEYERIRPGVMTLSQEMRWRNNFRGKVVAGNFTNNRMGAQAEVMYRTGNGRLEMGAVMGMTAQSIVGEEGWFISRKLRMDAAVKASVYEPRLNLQLDVQAGRYLYGDYGVRGDCIRHFGEYTVGLYAMYTGGETNGGFNFTIPLPGKKRATRKAVRVMQPEYFAWEYSMVSWGKYIDRNMGRTYETRPDNNASEHYFQPEYIRYFLLKENDK